MEGDVRAQDLCYRQRVFSLSASKPSFLALVRPVWSGFPLGKGYITDSVVLLAVIHFQEGLSARDNVTNLSILPAPASSQLQDLPVARHSFSSPADHSALGFELTSDLELFIQNFLVFQLKGKTLLFYESRVDVIMYFPSRHAADMHW